MADFTSDLAVPVSTAVLPKVTQDLGSIQTLTAQAAATVNGADQVNVGSSGAIITIDITAITGTLTVTVQRKDKASGKYVNLLSSTALGSVATTVLKITPRIAASANAIAQDWIGETFRVSSVVGTGPCTATIGATLIP